MTEVKADKTVYCVQLQPVSGNWLGTPDQRFKALLKRALRNHGLKCNWAISVELKENKP